ncbi:hypothetical protein CPC16_001236 [Podila verticillata]|nr:hypothetical protein CPC16_001236 [Podila verticillata]
MFHKFQSVFAKDALIRNAPFVRELHTPHNQVVRWFVQPTVSSLAAQSLPLDIPPVNCICKNLVRLHVKAVNQSLVIPLIKSNPRLRTLIWDAAGDIQDALLLYTSTYLPVLEVIVLEARIHPIHPQTLKQFLEALPESVCTISLHVSISRRLTTPSMDLSENRQHPQLESIKVEGDMDDEDEYIFAEFLGSCSMRLRKVILSRHAHLRISKLFGVLERLEAVPNTLFLCRKEGPEDTRDELTDLDVSQMISRSVKWTRIDIRTQRNVGALTAAAIASHCQKLETLSLSDCPRVNSSDIQSILTVASNLLYLDINSNGNFAPPQLQASDVVSSSWACSSLEGLSANIVGVPRPDVTLQHNGQPTSGALHSGTVADSHAIQRRVLAQIGMLTGLQELHLGNNELSENETDRFGYDPATKKTLFVDDHFQLTCLELSLASGLDQLSELKGLEVLDVTRMAHRIGVAELEWMQENWPCLERVEGLFNEWYDILEPGVRSWLKKHKPRWGEIYTYPDEDDYFFDETGARGGCYLYSQGRWH